MSPQGGFGCLLRGVRVEGFVVERYRLAGVALRLCLHLVFAVFSLFTETRVETRQTLEAVSNTIIYLRDQLRSFYVGYPFQVMVFVKCQLRVGSKYTS